MAGRLSPAPQAKGGTLIAGDIGIGRQWTRALQIAMRVAFVAALSAGAAYLVWLAGLDALWAVTTVLAFGSVVAVLVTMKLEERASWEPPGRDTPRGIRLTFPMVEESLAACDRLARPPIMRLIRAMAINERDDQLARATLLRQMRALLVAELRVRGVDPSHQSDESVVALLGPDALTVLQPNDNTPVTTAAIASCLDAVERLCTDPLPSQ